MVVWWVYDDYLKLVIVLFLVGVKINRILEVYFVVKNLYYDNILF